MWHIKETSETYTENVQIALDATHPGKGKSNGVDGEVISGHSFFQVKECLR